ncbi:MAG: ATP-binding protein [Armatimonadota bacterium]
MKNWPLRWRIALWFSLMATVILVVTGLYINHVVIEDHKRLIRRDLLAQTRLAGLLVADALSADSQRLQELAAEVDAQAGARVTVIGPDGAVLADSREDPDEMENHANRPERQQALRESYGAFERHSETLGIDMLYVASSLPDSDGTVLRLALPLTDVQKTATRLHTTTLVTFVIAVIVIWLISGWLVSSLWVPVDRLVEIVRRVGRGELGVRSDIDTGRLSELAGAFNESMQRLQQRVEESERQAQRYTAILAQMTDAVVVITPQGRVVFINEAFSRLFGVSSDDVEGQYIEEIALNYELSALLTRAATQKTLQRGEVRVLHPEPRDLIAVATPLHDDDNEITGVVGLLHDATELLRMDQVRRDFVANASHELRTPASSIRAMAEVLRDGAINDPERGPQFVQRILEAADNLTHLLDDMLTLTRVERGQELLNPEYIDVGDAFENAIKHIEPAAEAKDISLQQKFEPDGNEEVYVDKSSLQTVLINLLENAVKYTPSGGDVRLEGQKVSGGYHVSVTDTGVGIADEELSRIFERFYRIDKARGRDTGGTGLGLAIVKNIAEAHGGRVRVNSKPGEGSTFSVFFPDPEAGEDKELQQG